MAAIQWPDGKSFAFTVVDDTDRATLKNVVKVYDFLRDLNFRTTKTVWPSRGIHEPVNGGATCEDADYVDWLLKLQDSGFEIGYHLNTYHTSTRQEIIAGLDRFKALFGHDPLTAANHVGCRDGIYWGDARFDGLNRFIYNLANRFTTRDISRGHVEGDPLFWGDVCNERIKYLRGFVFKNMNSIRHCAFMPYHDPSKPYVAKWFSSSDGGDLNAYLKCVTEDHIDRLEEEGGVCIMYTHFAFGFCDSNGNLNSDFERIMQRLSQRNGWFAPTHKVLDHLESQHGAHVVTPPERRRLERVWLAEKLKVPIDRLS
jgi:hypothetical protein